MICNNRKCNKEIPNDSKLCPYCGKSTQKFKINKTKKGCFGCLSFVVLIFIVLMIIGSCANNNSSSNTSTIKQTKASALKMGQSFKSNKFELTVLDKKITDVVYDKTGYLAYKPDGVFIVITLKYKNISNERNRLDNTGFSLICNNKTYSPINIMPTGNDIFLDAINPGIEKTGDLYFDVPADVANNNFILKVNNSFFSDTFNGEVELY